MPTILASLPTFLLEIGRRLAYNHFYLGRANVVRLARGPFTVELVVGRDRGGSSERRWSSCVVETRCGCINAADGLPSDAAATSL